MPGGKAMAGQTCEHRGERSSGSGDVAFADAPTACKAQRRLDNDERPHAERDGNCFKRCRRSNSTRWHVDSWSFLGRSDTDFLKPKRSMSILVDYFVGAAEQLGGARNSSLR